MLHAGDGIRHYKVTGVQTCALPIYTSEETKWKHFKKDKKRSRGKRSNTRKPRARSSDATKSLSRRIMLDRKSVVRERVEISGVGGARKKKVRRRAGALANTAVIRA